MSTKIEKTNPTLTELAELLGGEIYYRGGDWWLGPWNHQITFDRDERGGQGVDLDLTGKAALAEEILRNIVAARRQPDWGDPWTRAQRVLAGLREELIPAYREGNFCDWRHVSMDASCIVYSLGVGSAWLWLVGEEEIRADGPSIEDAVDAVEQKAQEIFGTKACTAG